MDLLTTAFELREDYKGDIKRAIEASSKDPITCPCCDVKVKVYKRKLNAGMAITLIKMYQHSRLEYCHVINVQSKQCTDYPQLRHWGLIHECIEHEDGKKTSGTWRVTSRGYLFLTGSPVRKYIHTINNELIDFSGEMVFIKDCLPDNFNYQELIISKGW